MDGKGSEKIKFNIKATKTCICEEGKMVDIESEQLIILTIHEA